MLYTLGFLLRQFIVAKIAKTKKNVKIRPLKIWTIGFEDHIKTSSK